MRVFTKTCPEGHEIASFRKDVSVHGRDNKSDDVKVETGKHITIEDDVMRRDLSINALFYDIKTNEVVDLVGGVDDIKNGVIRTVGNPFDRFNEDRLRIIRSIRFSATTGFEIHKDTHDAILTDNRLFGVSDIDDVSKERIYAEFDKVVEKSISNNDSFIMIRFFEMMNYYGITYQLYPVNINPLFIKSSFSLSIIISQLLVNNDINEGFVKMLSSSKMNNSLLNDVVFLINIFRHGICSHNVYDTYKRMTSKNIDIELVKEWVSVMDIDSKEFQTFFVYKPTTNGKDVMSDGFKGLSIGEEIKRREKLLFEEMLRN